MRSFVVAVVLVTSAVPLAAAGQFCGIAGACVSTTSVDDGKCSSGPSSHQERSVDVSVQSAGVGSEDVWLLNYCSSNVEGDGSHSADAGLVLIVSGTSDAVGPYDAVLAWESWGPTSATSCHTLASLGLGGDETGFDAGCPAGGPTLLLPALP